MTMTISDTKPINVVYTSSLKLGVENLLANPDDTMSKYLQANSQDGKASFYSNDWEQGLPGQHHCELRALKRQHLLLLHQRHAHLH